MSVVDNIKTLESKQKVMLVAIVILVGVALYMGYATFFPSDGTTPAPAPVKTSVPSRPVLPMTPPQSQTTQSATQAQSQQDGQLKFLEKPKTSAPTPEQLAILAQSQQLQEEYVHLVGQYQIAQLEQKLASTNAAIAQQKLSATKSSIEVQKLQGALSQQTPTLSQSTSSSTSKSTGPSGPIQVMYVGRQAGHWTAMLGGSGSYFEVNIGTYLPDGSVVSAISSKGVTLNKAGQLTYLAIPKTLD